MRKLSEEELIGLFNNAHVDAKRSNIISDCPYCGKEQKFGVAIERLYKGRYHPFQCFSCGETGTAFKLLKHLDKLFLILGDKQVIFDAVLENKIKIQDTEELDLTLPRKAPPLGFRRTLSDPYFDSRGFVKEDYDLYRVGRSKLEPAMKDYVIMLVDMFGECKGYVARCLWDKKKIEEYNIKAKIEGKKKKLRYDNSKNTDFQKLLFGFDEIIPGVTKTAILVEGVFGKTNVTRQLNLDKSPNVKCLATFGKKISEFQIAHLQNIGIENIIVIYDNDAVEQSKRYSVDLSKYFNTMVGFLKDDRDPGDLGEDELGEVLENLEDPLNFRLNKVLKKKLI